MIPLLALLFLAEERMNIYLIAGYIFDIHPMWKFKPAALVKAVSGAPLQVDLSANFLYNEKFTLGAAYRWDAAISAMFGFQLTDQLLVGLAYDREVTELGGTRFNDGSFEIMLRYEFLTRYRRQLPQDSFNRSRWYPLHSRLFYNKPDAPRPIIYFFTVSLVK